MISTAEQCRAEQSAIEPVDVLAQIRRLLAEDEAAPRPAAPPAPAPVGDASNLTGLPPAAWGDSAASATDDEDWPPRLPDLPLGVMPDSGGEEMADRLWHAAASRREGMEPLADNTADPDRHSAPGPISPLAVGETDTLAGWPGSGTDTAVGALIADLDALDRQLEASRAAVDDVLARNLAAPDDAGDDGAQGAVTRSLPPLLLEAGARVGGVCDAGPGTDDADGAGDEAKGQDPATTDALPMIAFRRRPPFKDAPSEEGPAPWGERDISTTPLSPPAEVDRSQLWPEEAPHEDAAPIRTAMADGDAGAAEATGDASGCSADPEGIYYPIAAQDTAVASDEGLAALASGDADREDAAPACDGGCDDWDATLSSCPQRDVLIVPHNFRGDATDDSSRAPASPAEGPPDVAMPGCPVLDGPTTTLLRRLIREEVSRVLAAVAEVTGQDPTPSEHPG